MVTIADTPEALTAAWLTEALAGVLEGAAVTDVSATPVGTGQMCDSVRLPLTYDRPVEAPASVIAKLPAAAARGEWSPAPGVTSSRQLRCLDRAAVLSGART